MDTGTEVERYTEEPLEIPGVEREVAPPEPARERPVREREPEKVPA